MKKIIIGALALTATLNSCQKEFLDTESTKEVLTANITSDASFLQKVVDGMHRMMYTPAKNEDYTDIGGNTWRHGHATMMTTWDLMGEDVLFTAAPPSFGEPYNWKALSSSTSDYPKHAYFYQYVFINNANLVINNYEKTKGEAKLRNYAAGQAFAFRAFAYFNLVQCFGEKYDTAKAGNNTQLGVPIRLSSSQDGNLARSTVEEVYTLINKDLDQALTLLSGNDYRAKYNKSHIDESVVRGFKARVALTQGRWADAAAQAKLARAPYTLMSQTQYRSGFNDMSNNNEWMWGSKPNQDQIEKGNFGWIWARNNVQTSSLIIKSPFAMALPLYNSFPDTDVRKQLVDPTGNHTSLTGVTLPPFKPKYTSRKFLLKDVAIRDWMDVPYMRAAEMYLIEAEALARDGKEAESKIVFTQLEKARNTAYVTSTKTGEDYINQIMLSRRIELWGEGFRYLDLKRIGKGLDRTGYGHNTTWSNNLVKVNPTDKRWSFLIPQIELNTNSLMIQNPTN